MQKKILFSEVIVPQSEEISKEFSLKYYLVVTEKLQKGSLIETFGIEVAKFCEPELHDVESKLIDDIFTSKEKVTDILEILYRNLVTPVTLVDVVSDLISYDFEQMVVKKGA